MTVVVSVAAGGCVVEDDGVDSKTITPKPEKQAIRFGSLHIFLYNRYQYHHRHRHRRPRYRHRSSSMSSSVVDRRPYYIQQYLLIVGGILIINFLIEIVNKRS